MVGALQQLRTVSCFSIALMVARTLRALDFQPRLGLVTRTIAKAAQDLLHFLFIFLFVFVAFASMGHLTFGGATERFSTMASSLTVCMAILLGDIDVLTDLYRGSVPGSDQRLAADFFFWSFIFVAFFILINMLLAILVDAYVAVKDQAESMGSRTVPDDCYHILSSLLPSAANRAHSRHVDLVFRPLQRSFRLAAKQRREQQQRKRQEQQEQEEEQQRL